MTSFPHWTACPWAFILFICVIYLTLTADQHFTYNQTCFIYLSLPLRNMETFPPSPLSLFLLSPFLFLLPPAMGILLAVSRVTCAFWGRLLTGGAAPDSSSLSHGCKIAFPCLPATYWVPTSPHPCWSRGVIRHRYPPIWWDDVLFEFAFPWVWTSFSRDYWTLVSFSVNPVYIFCSFINWAFILLIKRIAYILHINPLSYLLAANNFFKSVGWFFILFVVPLWYRCFHFKKTNLIYKYIYTCFLDNLWFSHLKKSFHIRMS